MRSCILSLFAALSVALPAAGQGRIPAAEAAAIEAACPGRPSAAPGRPRLLLVFNRCEGFRHSALPYGAAALEALGRKSGAFAVEESEEMDAFRPENLARFDAVCFNNSTGLRFDDPALRAALLDYVRGGGGIVGIHGATDSFPTWPEGAALIGGLFDGHPWEAGGTWGLRVEEPGHPLVAAFAERVFTISEEIYRIRPVRLREECRVLLGLDLCHGPNFTAKGIRSDDFDVPVSWIKRAGKGRLFYCSLGHNHAVFQDPRVLRHYLDGIQFALGDLGAAAEPRPFDPLQAAPLDAVDRIAGEAAGYSFGASRLALVQLAHLARLALASPPARAGLEGILLGRLQGPASAEARRFFAEQLGSMGTEACLPGLLALHAEAGMADVARNALERIPGSRIDEALRGLLARAGGAERAGLAAALGARRDPSSAAALSALIYDPDARVASAALSALGSIASPDALAALGSARERLRGPLRRAATDATLRAAETLAARGGKREARVLFEELLGPGEEPQARAAGLRGLAYLEPERAPQRLLQAVRGPDGRLRSAALGLLGELPGGVEIRPFAAELPRLEPDQQVQLLAALALRRDPVALPAVRAAAEAEEQSVRASALTALGTIGGAEEAVLLARHAAGAGGAAQKAAREALIALPAPGADERLLAALPGAAVAEQLEILRAVEARLSPGAAEPLLRAAREADPRVRLAAIKALKVGGSAALPGILDLLKTAPEGVEQAELVRSAVIVARAAAGAADPALPVLAALRETAGGPARGALFSVLGRIGGNAALGALRTALAAPEKEIRSAALKALAEWPDQAPLGDLRRMAAEERDPVLRLLALRGFIRLIEKNGTDEAARAGLLREAMALAGGPAEKRLVLAGAGSCAALSALELAGSCLHQADLAAEAAAAVARCAAKVFFRDYAGTRALLDQVLALPEAAGAAEEARKTLERIKEFEDYLVEWRVAGPFSLAGGGYAGLLEHPFAPETGAAPGVEWQPLRSRIGPEDPALIDLNTAIGGQDRAVYVRTWVFVAEAGQALLLLGSDDGIKAWLNGAQVFAKDAVRGVTRDQERVPVVLRKGWNQLLLKVAQGWGEWGFTARLRTPGGGKLPGLRSRPQIEADEVERVRIPEGAFQAWAGPGTEAAPSWGYPESLFSEALLADAFMGEWSGRLKAADGSETALAARVIPLGTAGQIVDLLADLDGRDAPLARWEGRAQGGTLVCGGEATAGPWAGTAWAGRVEAGLFSGTLRGARAGSFELRRVLRLSPSLGARPPADAFILLGPGRVGEWKHLTGFPGHVDLARLLGGGEKAAAYLRARVWSGAAREALLALGSDDGVKAWLNGREVHANGAERGLARDQDRIPVRLEQGLNELLLKVVNAGGGWAACARFLTPDGAAPLADLEQEAAAGGRSREALLRSEGFLTRFELAGPFTIQGMDAAGLLGRALPLEAGGAAEWRRIEAGVGEETGIRWPQVAPGILEVGQGSIVSRRAFTDFELHLEFRTPLMPEARGQARGNSGVYLQGRYEIQILDSFGLEGRDNECGGIYKVSAPRVNMCAPPLQWQTYDIAFRAPRFGPSGEKLSPATVTVLHNGVPIHVDLELPGPTGGAADDRVDQPGGLYLQDHSNPVQFRNVWGRTRT